MGNEVRLQKKSMHERIGGTTGALLSVLLEIEERLQSLEEAANQPQETTMSQDHLLRARDYLNLAQRSDWQTAQWEMNLLACLDAMLSWAEAQSQATSPTTEPATREAPSAAPASPIEAPTPLSQRLLGALTEAERSHVAQCLNCEVRLEAFVSSLPTPVLDAAGINST